MKRQTSEPTTRRPNHDPRYGRLSAPVPRPLWRFPATTVGDQAPCLVADELTPRERQVARYVALGMRNAEVAAALGITPGTAKLHVYRIFKKLGLVSRRELGGYALRVGLV